MIKIKNFSIFKSKDTENPKAPTHRVSAKVGEEYISIGSGWTKETKGGDKFLSIKLNDVFLDHTDNSKSRKSIVLVDEAELKALYAKAGEDYVDESQIPPVKAPKTSQDEF